jgi:hypothetical protein
MHMAIAGRADENEEWLKASMTGFTRVKYVAVIHSALLLEGHRVNHRQLDIGGDI